MKHNPFRSEFFISALLIILTLLFLNPLQRVWMPSMFMSGILLGFVVVFLLFTAMVWKETTGDERDVHHRHVAGRISFLVGTALLVAGIIYQCLEGTLDPWLLVVLCGMVITKLLARLYQDITN